MEVKLNARLDTLAGNVWDLALIIPPEYVEALDMQGSKRIICRIGDHSFHGALMSRGDGTFFVNTNKELRKKTGIEKGDLVPISLRKDESKIWHANAR